MRYLIVYILVTISFLQKVYGQLIISAGNNRTICYNANVLLGAIPTAQGGTEPYTYNWQPSTFLNSNTISNPLATACTSDITYRLIVTDKNGLSDTSFVNITINKINDYTAGTDTGYCFGQKNGVQIGASINSTSSSHSFNWTPASGLDNPSSPNPIATPTVATVYQLIVSDASCPSHITQVTVTPFMPPFVDAGLDTIIDEGNTITLNGTGGSYFNWTPSYNISYSFTKKPDIWPTTSTTYTLYTEDSNKCYNSDTVRVTVKKGDKLFFYSAFTPNKDGDNDVYYIGNIDKYPDNSLKIYNRYGKIIFSANNYDNSWDGTYLGDDAPAGTYFYIFNDGKNKEYKGSVTIMR